MSKVNILISSFLKLLFNDEAVSHGHVHWEQQAGKVIIYDPFTQDRSVFKSFTNYTFLYRVIILIHYTHKCDETVHLSVT